MCDKFKINQYATSFGKKKSTYIFLQRTKELAISFTNKIATFNMVYKEKY